MIGQVIEESETFEKPNPDTIMISNQINRPEIKLFDAQSQFFETKKSAITASYMPRLNLFVQGGYGRPGLNMLNRDFSPFYIGGIRLAWNFGALYTQKNDRLKLSLAQLNTETLRETFLYHTNLEITQQNAQLERLRKMMSYDNDIISLRENIRLSAEAKVASGTMTVTEWMHEVTAENVSRQEKITHEIELLTAIYDLKYSMNN
jgi:outer membrane protein TolC